MDDFTICVKCYFRWRDIPKGASPEEFVKRRRERDSDLSEFLKQLNMLAGSTLDCPCCLESKLVHKDKHGRFTYSRQNPLGSIESLLICSRCAQAYNSKKRNEGDQDFINCYKAIPLRSDCLKLLSSLAGSYLKYVYCLKSKIVDKNKSKRSLAWLANRIESISNVTICSPCWQSRPKKKHVNN